MVIPDKLQTELSAYTVNVEGMTFPDGSVLFLAIRFLLLSVYHRISAFPTFLSRDSGFFVYVNVRSGGGDS